jgi:hypothetical protein
MNLVNPMDINSLKLLLVSHYFRQYYLIIILRFL